MIVTAALRFNEAYVKNHKFDPNTVPEVKSGTPSSIDDGFILSLLFNHSPELKQLIGESLLNENCKIFDIEVTDVLKVMVALYVKRISKVILL